VENSETGKKTDQTEAGCLFYHGTKNYRLIVPDFQDNELIFYFLWATLLAANHLKSIKSIFVILLFFIFSAVVGAQSDDATGEGTGEFTLAAPDVKNGFAINEEYNVKLKIPEASFRRKQPDNKKEAGLVFSFEAAQSKVLRFKQRRRIGLF
jgi:hypothetical protein